MTARLGGQPWQPDWGGSNPTKGGKVDPQFVADYKALGLTVLRCMDAIPINGSTIKTWSQRKAPNDASQGNPGVAIELLIDAANQMNADLWMCHPYLADDDYITQCAETIKKGLNAGLRVFIELGNEQANGGFLSFNQAISAGQAGGLPGSNQWYQGIAHSVYRSLQMFKLYENVFGAAVMGSKVIRVVAEMGNLDTLSSALSGVYQVGKWNPAAQKIDMIATAPYVGNGTNGASETLERFKSEVDRHVSGEPIATAKGQAKTNGIPYVGAYEFGSHHLQNADKFTSNDMAEQAITYMLQQYSAAFNAPMCFYTSHGTQKPDGSWGLLPTVGADIAKWPRARAVQAFTR